MSEPENFNDIYKNPTIVWHTPYFVIFYKEKKGHNVAFVSSKKIGNAIKRNRAKRLLKALFINYSDTLSEGSYIFVSKAKILDEGYTMLSKSFLVALKKSSLAKYS
ncbi:MAG: ribonuclease P protein component [Campylobacterales bacterium]|nr:ribonuclease P protein component [Campylobacterales bacterium]